MADNYYRILEIIEKSSDAPDIDNEELRQLMVGMTRFDRGEIVKYCTIRMGRIQKKILVRDFKYTIFGVSLAGLIYIILLLFFPVFIADDFSGLLLILPSVYLVFCLRPKNNTLLKTHSKYKKFKTKFSSN
ncbi:MAG: hypothetical protein QNJ18_23960 [Xenococcaceae cyanobacterium MO_167.B52]|nr:hypothetical protein [Xenococcaceae cyanobacterium MO_167.B52]